MSSRKIPATIAEATTPCFLVDIDRLKKNAKQMIDTCQQLKVDLRCHTKTHKTVEAAEILTGGTRRKIACSTLPECEMYADNHFEDILLAYPISADKVPRCVLLANRLEEFHVMVSGLEGLKCLQEGASDLVTGKQWSVFLELDCGYGRTGFCWDSDTLLEAASQVHKDPHMKLQGLYTHCGESYNLLTPGELKNFQQQLVKKLLGAAKSIRAEGIEVPVVGTGSTPTCNHPDPVLSSLDELHPGNYVFNDNQQVQIGSCHEEEVACCVATRVVGHRPEMGTLIVDCGFLGLSHDGRQQVGDNFCKIKDHPHLRLSYFSQELGKVTAEGRSMNFDQHPVGSMLFLYPYHSCATAAMYDQYLVHSGQKIVGAWKPVRGW